MDVPEAPEMAVGLRVMLSPADGVAVSVTAPANPFWGVTVMVEVPEVLGLSGPTLAGLAEILKS